MSLAKRAIELGVKRSPSEESKPHEIGFVAKAVEVIRFIDVCYFEFGITNVFVDEHGKVLVSKIIPEEEV